MTAVITLTTDFGARDPYVAEMKAVILGLNPTVRLIDVSHEIAAHDVIEGALAVQAMAAVCQRGRGARGERGRAIPRAARDDGPPQSVDDFAGVAAGALVDAESLVGAWAFSVFSEAGFSAAVVALPPPLFSDSRAFFRDSEG